MDQRGNCMVLGKPWARGSRLGLWRDGQEICVAGAEKKWERKWRRLWTDQQAGQARSRGAWGQGARVGVTVCAAAAAAKSLQLCPTLCDPTDGSLEQLYLKRLLLYICPVVSATPWTTVCQTSLFAPALCPPEQALPPRQRRRQ